MSCLVDLAMFAVKAASGSRLAIRLTGRDTPLLDDVHQASAPVRHQFAAERAQGAGADISSVGQNDPTDEECDGIIDTVLDWFADLF